MFRCANRRGQDTRKKGQDIRKGMSLPCCSRVCLHVVRPVRVDVRAQRTRQALADAGYTVTLIDVEETRPFSFLKMLRAFARSLYAVLRCDADIYHACEVTALPACFIAAKIRRKPLIFEAYEMPLHDVPLAEMGKLRRVFHIIFSLLLPRLLPACQAIIAVSPPIVAEITRRYRNERVFLVRNILPYRAVTHSERLRDYLGLAPSTRVVLYQGYLQADRGLDILVRAAPLLDHDIVIVLMGKGIGETQARLESLICELDIVDRVKIIPPVPYDELLDWTASADIGLTPLSPEQTLTMQWCLPNKVFEYIMAGLPILSGPLEAVQELLARYDVGQTFSIRSQDTRQGMFLPYVVNEYDESQDTRQGMSLPSALAHGINSMLADCAILARMHENALRAARELCWENEQARLIEVYETVRENGS
jgi:glycosyltransferase involved in cell wall biosynthesis